METKIDYFFDGAKILAQMGGALVVAWLTVRWALSRYKSEKIWERQLSIYSDLLSAVFNLSEILAKWDAHYNKHLSLSEAEMDALRPQYELNRQRIRDASKLALIVVPFPHAILIGEIEEGLEAAFDEVSDQESLNRELEILEKSKLELLVIARRTLGTSHLHVPRLVDDPAAWFKYRNNKRWSYADNKQRSD